MNTKGFKQMLIGEKMPDKDDPKYKERYERDVRAGRKFARMCRIDKAAAKVQKFADLHKTMFLVIVFGFVGVSFSFNIYRMARAYHYQGERRTATERQDSLIKARHQNMGNAKNIVRTNEDARILIKTNNDEADRKNQFQTTQVHATCDCLSSTARCLLLYLRPL